MQLVDVSGTRIPTCLATYETDYDEVIIGIEPWAKFKAFKQA